MVRAVDGEVKIELFWTLENFDKVEKVKTHNFEPRIPHHCLPLHPHTQAMARAVDGEVKVELFWTLEKNVKI